MHDICTNIYTFDESVKPEVRASGIRSTCGGRKAEALHSPAEPMSVVLSVQAKYSMAFSRS